MVTRNESSTEQLLYLYTAKLNTCGEMRCQHANISDITHTSAGITIKGGSNLTSTPLWTVATCMRDKHASD